MSQDRSQSQQPVFSFLPKLIDGFIAGTIGVACVIPLDLIKTRMTIPDSFLSRLHVEKKYWKIFDCSIKTYRYDGYFGMYRDTSVTIVLTGLTANDYLRHRLAPADGHLPLINQMAAGAMSGGLQCLFSTPLELLKMKLHEAGRVAAKPVNAKMEQSHLTSLGVIAKVFKDRGIVGMYRGIGSTAALDIIFGSIHYPLFALLDNLGPRSQDGTGKAVFWTSFLAGFTSAAFTTLVCTPVDVIRSRLKHQRFRGIIDCGRKTYQRAGVLGLFKGGFCRVIVIAPLMGITQMVYYLNIGQASMNIIGNF